MMRDFNDKSSFPVTSLVCQGTMPVFMALALILLAFFIILHALSSREALSEEEGRLSASRADTPFPDPVSDFPMTVEARAVLEVLAQVFKDELPFTSFEVLPSETALQIRLRTDVLFVPDTADVRPSRWRFLDRIVSATSILPAGFECGMELYLGSAYDLAGDPLTEPTMQMKRAEAFARVLTGRGMTPSLLSVGIEEGESRKARMVFRVSERTPGSRKGGGHE